MRSIAVLAAGAIATVVIGGGCGGLGRADGAAVTVSRVVDGQTEDLLPAANDVHPASISAAAAASAAAPSVPVRSVWASPHHVQHGGRRLADIGRCKGLFIANKAQDEAGNDDDFIMESGVMSNNWNGQTVNMATADEDVREVSVENAQAHHARTHTHAHTRVTSNPRAAPPTTIASPPRPHITPGSPWPSARNDDKLGDLLIRKRHEEVNHMSIC